MSFVGTLIDLIARALRYLLKRREQREDYERSAVGEVEEFQRAVSGDDDESEKKMQSIFARWRLRRRTGDDERL